MTQESAPTSNFDGIEMALVERAVNNQVNEAVANLAAETICKLDQIVAEGIRKLKHHMPNYDTKEVTGKEFIPMFKEYLDGKKYHDPDENK